MISASHAASKHGRTGLSAVTVSCVAITGLSSHTDSLGVRHTHLAPFTLSHALRNDPADLILTKCHAWGACVFTTKLAQKHSFCSSASASGSLVCV